MMNIIRFDGGLGNQMFQYAFGLSLAKLNNFEMSLYIDDVKIHNGFELSSVFNINDKYLSKNDLKDFLGLDFFFYDKGFRRRAKIFFLLSKIQYEDNKSTIDFVNLVKSYLYFGNWQNLSYFSNNDDLIKKIFKFKNITPKNEQLADEISSRNSVAIHVRRGDFTSKGVRRVINLMDESYYNKAINLICAKDNNLHFYVFSDDINWTKNNLNFNNNPTTFISHNRNRFSYQDMYLMTFAKHNIIPNSTFSWWGSWLKNRNSGAVICPINWYVDGRCMKNLLPTKWYLI